MIGGGFSIIDRSVLSGPPQHRREQRGAIGGALVADVHGRAGDEFPDLLLVGRAEGAAKVLEGVSGSSADWPARMARAAASIWELSGTFSGISSAAMAKRGHH